MLSSRRFPRLISAVLLLTLSLGTAVPSYAGEDAIDGSPISTAEAEVSSSEVESSATPESDTEIEESTAGGNPKRADLRFTSSDVATPTVTVSKTTVSADGSTTVTVSGSGFDPAAAIGSRPPLAGVSGGAYVVFGKFPANWKPSAGVPSTQRKPLTVAQGGQKWAVPAASMGTIGGDAAGAIALNPDGTFTTELVIDKSLADSQAVAVTDAVNYGVYTYPGSGASQPAFETYTPIYFPEITLSKTTVSADGSTTVTVSGSGFDPAAAIGSRPPLAGVSGGAYVVFGKFPANWKPSAGVPSTQRKPLTVAQGGQKWAVPAASMGTIGGDAAGAIALNPDGTFTTELVIDKSLADSQAVAVTDAVNYGVYTYPGSGASQPAFETYTAINFSESNPGPEPEPDPQPDNDTDAELKTGQLSWGVDDAFRAYVTNFAGGTIVTSNGVAYSRGNFRFGQTSTNAVIPDSVGTTSYRGSVRFRAHGGALDLSFSDPVIRVTSSTAATLTMRVNGKRVNLANLNLKTGSSSASSTGITYRNVRATLTAEGARSFLGFYSAGRTLDEVDFVIGSAASGGQVGSSVIAGSTKTWQPPSTPPATTGVNGMPETDIGPGETISITADGFLANETNIKVVVYSTPVVLAEDAKADAAGQVSWTGELPEGLEPGEHTITIQGSVARGAVFTVAGPVAIAGQCPITSASMTWGFKESFRSYISGSFANGSWEVMEPTTYQTPNFTFPEAQGSFNASDTTGEIEFAGGIRFRAHNDELDSFVSQPRIVFLSENRARMYVDIAQNNRELAVAGKIEYEEFEDVDFLELRLGEASVEREGSTVTFTDIPAVFTAQGEATFGTYQEGDLFDPITLVIDADPNCNDQQSAAANPNPDDLGSEFMVYGAGALAILALMAIAWWGARQKRAGV